MPPDISPSPRAVRSAPATYATPAPHVSETTAATPKPGLQASQSFDPLPLKSDGQQHWDFKQIAVDKAPGGRELDRHLAGMADIPPIQPCRIPQQVREEQARDVLDQTMRHLDRIAGEYRKTREKMAASGHTEGIANLEDEISQFLASAERTMVALGAGIRKDQLEGPPSPDMEMLLNFATAGFWSTLRDMQQKMQAAYETPSPRFGLGDQEAMCREILRQTVEKMEVMARRMAVEKGRGHASFRPENLPAIIQMLTQVRHAGLRAEGLLNAARNSPKQVSAPLADEQASHPGDVDYEEAE